MSLSLPYVITVILAFSAAIFCQDKPRAILVDEFETISCGDLLSRTDHFIVELQQNPQDTGYALIYKGGRNPDGFIKFISASLLVRRFDRERIKVILAESKIDGVNGSFWRVPPEAEPPDFDAAVASEPDVTKPFLYGRNYSDNACPSFSPDLFSKMILSNPGSKARIVVSAPTVQWRLQTAKAEIAELEPYILRNRITVYYVHRPRQQYSTTEYWFIPGK